MRHSLFQSLFCIPLISLSQLVPEAKSQDVLSDPYAISAVREADIARGKRIPVLDVTASLLATPIKLVLWNWKYGNHKISDQTESRIRDFIERNELWDVKIRLNECAPWDEMKRLFRNKKIGLPYRLLGIPSTLLTATTGRLLAGLIFSDYYDPMTNTVHVFSDDTAIALHEGGHAKDFSKQEWPGTYAMVRNFPGVNLAQEIIATQEALDYFDLYGPDEDRIRAPKVLYPAFATYAGSYLQMLPMASVGALAGGHLYGGLRSKYIREEIEARNQVKQSFVQNSEAADIPVTKKIAPENTPGQLS